MNKTIKNPYILYSLLFFVMAGSIYFTFLIHLKSFLWVTDGYYQHWMAFAYYGRMIREIAANLWETHSLVIPEYDFSLGMGAGVIPTLHYYCIGDPFCILSAFVPMAASETAYGILIFVRLYLAGISFLFYAHYTGRRGLGLTAGALSYVFCGYALFAAVRHPFFINPMITFPLLLYGVEKIIREKKTSVFVIVVAAAVTCNFYFAYMQGAFVCLYIIFRYGFFRRERKLKDIFEYAAPMIVSGIVGIAMAAFILIPVLLAMLSSGRNGQPILSRAFYSLYYYVKLITSLLVPGGTGVWVHIGISVTGFLCALAVFAITKEEEEDRPMLLRSLRWAVAATFFGFLIPFFGKASNGFGYVTNRWEWLFEFVIAYAIAFVWDRLWTIESKRLVGILAGAFLYVCVLFVFDQGVNEGVFASAALLMASAGALLLARLGEEFRRPAICLFFIIGILHVCANGHYLFDEKESDYVAEFRSVGSSLSGVEESDAAMMSKAAERDGAKDRLVRYTNAGSVDVTNAELLTGAHSISFYWSIANANITQYMKDMALCKWWPWHYKGFEERSYLSANAAAGYVCGLADETKLPYGFGQEKSPGEPWEDEVIGKNEKFLPAACTYDALVSADDYESMTPYEKQEALLRGVLLSDEDRKEVLKSYKIGRADTKTSSKVMESEIELGEGIELNADGSITVKEKNAQMKISFKGLPESETYLFVGGLFADYKFSHEIEKEDKLKQELSENPDGSMEDGSLTETGAAEENDGDSLEEEEPEIPADWIDRIYESMDLTKKGWVESTTMIAMKVKGGGYTRTLAYFTPYDRHYVGQSDYLVNLGYHSKKIKSATVVFPQTGLYRAEAIRVVCQPMSDYDASVSARAEDPWENEKVTHNRLEGDITVDADRLLLLSVPCADGWEAYVDGEKTPLYRANVMYQAVPVHAGKHHIALVYHTPGLKLGGLVSLAGLLAFAGIVIVERKRAAKDRF